MSYGADGLETLRSVEQSNAGVYSLREPLALKSPHIIRGTVNKPIKTHMLTTYDPRVT